MAYTITGFVRELRGSSAYWVHMHGTGNFSSLEESEMDRKLNAEARRWARELGMKSGGWVSGGGEYGNEWRHSLCYYFKSK